MHKNTTSNITIEKIEKQITSKRACQKSSTDSQLEKVPETPRIAISFSGLIKFSNSTNLFLLSSFSIKLIFFYLQIFLQ